MATLSGQYRPQANAAAGANRALSMSQAARVHRVMAASEHIGKILLLRN